VPVVPLAAPLTSLTMPRTPSTLTRIARCAERLRAGLLLEGWLAIGAGTGGRDGCRNGHEGIQRVRRDAGDAGADPQPYGPTGRAFTISDFLTVVAIGYGVGAVTTTLGEYALHGRVNAASVAAGANWGAALAPLTVAYPTIGVVLGAGSTGYAAATFEPLFLDETVPWDRKVLAGGLVVAGLWVTGAQMKFVGQSRFVTTPLPPEPTITLYHKGRIGRRLGQRLAIIRSSHSEASGMGAPESGPPLH
jgi:hypothetical protein